MYVLSVVMIPFHFSFGDFWRQLGHMVSPMLPRKGNKEIGKGKPIYIQPLVRARPSETSQLPPYTYHLPAAGPE